MIAQTRQVSRFAATVLTSRRLLERQRQNGCLYGCCRADMRPLSLRVGADVMPYKPTLVKAAMRR